MVNLKLLCYESNCFEKSQNLGCTLKDTDLSGKRTVDEGVKSNLKQQSSKLNTGGGKNHQKARLHLLCVDHHHSIS